eukprot:TRINITY_DN10094_c0_g1_i2.p2 TRINITY_DN10094_c0_g1~~TRINITY_DN10094_c0_g1_i2.p2  ORF type:complete len:142 (-),score=11.76 TRINITY_DN10094_c0_g1_i2:91-477(-)
MFIIIRRSFSLSALINQFASFFFFNDTATTEIYTRSIVGSVRCVQETAIRSIQPKSTTKPKSHFALGEKGVDSPIGPSVRMANSKSTFGDATNSPTSFLAGKNVDSFCLLYTSPSPRDLSTSRMPSSA